MWFSKPVDAHLDTLTAVNYPEDFAGDRRGQRSLVSPLLPDLIHPLVCADRAERVEQRILVFTEAQNHVDAVDAASHPRRATFTQIVVVVRWEAAIIHHVHHIRWQMHPICPYGKSPQGNVCKLCPKENLLPVCGRDSLSKICSRRAGVNKTLKTSKRG